MATKTEVTMTEKIDAEAQASEIMGFWDDIQEDIETRLRDIANYNHRDFTFFVQAFEKYHQPFTDLDEVLFTRVKKMHEEIESRDS